MRDSYASREEAIAAAMADALARADLSEAATITTCRCDRRDLSDMSADKRSTIMDACANCERIIIGPASSSLC